VEQVAVEQVRLVHQLHRLLLIVVVLVGITPLVLVLDQVLPLRLRPAVQVRPAVVAVVEQAVLLLYQMVEQAVRGLIGHRHLIVLLLEQAVVAVVVEVTIALPIYLLNTVEQAVYTVAVVEQAVRPLRQQMQLPVQQVHRGLLLLLILQVAPRPTRKA
jgi:hypothetical protein